MFAWLFFGCITGFGVCYIYFQRKIAEIKIKNAELLKDISILEQNSQAFEVEKRKIIAQEQEKFNEIIKIKDKNLEDLKKSHEKQVFDLKNEYKTAIETQKADYILAVNEMRKAASEHFKNVATEILKKESTDLQKQGSDAILNILTPFKEEIFNLKNDVINLRESGAKNAGSFEEQIKKMSETTHGIATTAEKLANALKNDKKTVGNWGEMIVRDILDTAGLVEGKNYISQGKNLGLKSEEEKLQQPDFIIKLPDGKHIVLDSKVSLVNYEQYISSQDGNFLKEFIKNVENQAENLAKKKYHENEKLNAPDFTIMCIPIESAYLLAIKTDTSLYNKLLEKKIFICGPSNLIPILHIIGNLWIRDTQSKNAQQIARRAELINRKLGSFVSSIESIGKSLKKADDDYKTAYGQLIDGKSSLKSQLDDMHTLAKKGGIVIEGEIINEDEDSKLLN